MSNTPTNFTDCHCHLDLTARKMKLTIAQVWELARSAGAHRMVHVACDPQTIEASIDLRNLPGVYIAAGVHPHDASLYTPTVEARILELHQERPFIAWGEIGLDYHYMHSPAEVQKQVFIQQLKIAQQHKMSIVIHSREADQDCLQILAEYLTPDARVHVHCLTSTSISYALELLKLSPNLMIGFTGAVTFASAETLRKVVTSVPLNRILLETDAPFMAPVPHRGKPCHSGMIPHIAEVIATLHQTTATNVLQKTEENALKVYAF
jgi:TatD DNase family protein